MREVFNPGEKNMAMSDYQFKYIMDLKDKCAALEQELKALHTAKLTTDSDGITDFQFAITEYQKLCAERSELREENARLKAENATLKNSAGQN